MIPRRLAIITEESATMNISNVPVPAMNLYGGSFKEIRHFYHSVKRKIKTDLFIISSKYGLISGEDIFQDYSMEISLSKNEIISIGEKLQVFEEFTRISKKYDFILITLSRRYLPLIFFLKDNKNFMKSLRKEQCLIIITPNSLLNVLKDSAKKLGVKTFFLIRIGVSKIGKDNQEKVFSIIRGDTD